MHEVQPSHLYRERERKKEQIYSPYLSPPYTFEVSVTFLWNYEEDERNEDALLEKTEAHQPAADV